MKMRSEKTVGLSLFAFVFAIGAVGSLVPAAAPISEAPVVSVKPSITPTPKPVQTQVPTPVPVGDQPNILMITADDAAAYDLDFMPLTRRLIGDKGTTFTSAIAPTPICVPARATLLTGQYTAHHGALSISGSHGSVAAFNDTETLPVWLQSAGYDTTFVGKYLNGYGKATERTYVPPGWSNWQGSVDYTTYDFSRTLVNNNGLLEHGDVYNTDAFARRVNDSIATAEDSDIPWYTWVNYVAPHNGGPADSDDPKNWPGISDEDVVKTTTPADRHRDMYKDEKLRRTPSLLRIDPDKFFGRGAVERSKTNRRALREAYQQRLESLQAVDEAVASHVRALRRTGQLKNTLIVFSSDNGYFTGQHNLNGKLLWYEEALKLPMVMRGPGIPVGHVVSTPVSNADLPVTFAAIAGASPTRVVDGSDFRPFLTGAEQPRVVPLSAWPVRTNSKKTPRPLYTGVRVDNRWTYVVARRGHEELYDLVRDPHQLRNVAGKKRYADQVKKMRALTAQEHGRGVPAGTEVP